MNKKFLLVFILVLVVFCCTKPTEPIEIDVITTKEDLSNFQTILADYDSVIFKSNDDLLLKKRDVVEIILGTKDNYIFESIQTIVPVFSEVNSLYRLDFEIPAKVDEKTYLKHYVLRFVMIDDSYIDIDHSVHFYKYYYKNAEVFLEHHSIPQIYSFVDDFDIEGNSLFFHPSAAFGLYKYNFKTGLSTELFGYNGGEFISANEDFVFIDNTSMRVDRYNLSVDSVDSSLWLHVFDSTAVLPGLENSKLDISGLEIFNDSLFILFNQRNEEETAVLAVFDFNFNLIEYSFLEIGDSYPYYICIDDNILYMIDIRNSLIFRYDLLSKSFLKSIPSPIADMAGLDIYKNSLYFGGWIQETIFTIPMSDLMD